MYKEFLKIVGNGKPTGSVLEETIAVSATISINVGSTSIGTGHVDVVWCEEVPEVPSYLRNLSAYSRNKPRIALYDARTLEGACFRMFW